LFSTVGRNNLSKAKVPTKENVKVVEGVIPAIES
jgi:hypothetical protein